MSFFNIVNFAKIKMSELYLNSCENTHPKNKFKINFKMANMQDIPQDHYDLIMEFEDNMRKLGRFQQDKTAQP